MTASAAAVLMRRFGWLGVGLIGVLLLAIVLYAAAAIVLGLIPVNSDFHQSSDGVAIYVRGNGVHSDIVVPWSNPYAYSDPTGFFDWSKEFPQDSDDKRPYISFSWGDRGFYQDTPKWRDLRASVAIAALAGLGESLMRVEFAGPPKTEQGDVILYLSDEQYDRLLAQIRASFKRHRRGQMRPIPTPDYAVGITFYYEAFGSYSLLGTCNDWTRRTLTAAGVRMPLWSPFYTSIFHQLGQIPPLQQPPRSRIL